MQSLELICGRQFVRLELKTLGLIYVSDEKGTVKQSQHFSQSGIQLVCI